MPCRGRITEGTNQSTTRSITTSPGTANWHLNNNFAGTVTLGQNLNARNYRTFSVVGRRLIAPQPFSIINTLARDPASDYQTQIHNESYFGQATVDLFNQLF